MKELFKGKALKVVEQIKKSSVMNLNINLPVTKENKS